MGNIIKDDIYILHLFEGSILSPFLSLLMQVLGFYSTFLTPSLIAPNIQWVEMEIL